MNHVIHLATRQITHRTPGTRRTRTQRHFESDSTPTIDIDNEAGSDGDEDEQDYVVEAIVDVEFVDVRIPNCFSVHKPL